MWSHKLVSAIFQGIDRTRSLSRSSEGSSSLNEEDDTEEDDEEDEKENDNEEGKKMTMGEPSIFDGVTTIASWQK